MGGKKLFQALKNRYKQNAYPKAFLCISAALFVVWIVWCVCMRQIRYKNVYYPLIKVDGKLTDLTKSFVEFLLILLACYALFLLVLFFANTPKRFWTLLVCGVLCLTVFTLSHSAFTEWLPITSKTTDVKNYLIPDPDYSPPEDVWTVFPETADKDDDYLYYRHDSGLTSLNDRYFVLRKKADPAFVASEKQRLLDSGLVVEADEAWDGYETHNWNGYQILSTERAQIDGGCGYFWILLSDRSDSIIYYFRSQNLIKDTFLDDALKSFDK